MQLRLLFAALLVPLAAASPAFADELTVLAAASLTDALGEAAPAFTAATGHTLRFSFGGSGTLARQIREGAPADVFFPADELRLDQLDQAGLLLADTRRPIVGNTLVLVVAAENAPAVASLDDLDSNAEIRRVAIGDPATVPAGTYAKQHLDKSDRWPALRAKLAPTDSVRAALAAVEAGNADAAFVYLTDALASKRVRIALEFAPPEGPLIRYPAAIIKDSRQPAAARALIAWLVAPEAQAIFTRHGFLPAPAP